MKYIFVGGFWCKEDDNDILKSSRGSIQFAANELQLNILFGLHKNIGDDLSAISCKFIGSFPKRSKVIVVKKKTFPVFDNFLAYECGFLNLPIVKNFSKVRRLLKVISKEMNKAGDDVTIIGYSMTYSIVRTLSILKKKNPNIKVCLVVPDLPEYMSTNSNKSLIKKKIIGYLYNAIKIFDSFVTLTKFMFEKLNVPMAKYCLVDGIIPSGEQKNFNNSDLLVDPNEKRIVYTGTLEERYGVKKLVDSFEKIHLPNVKLVICGYGHLKDYIKEKADANKNIIYLGAISVENAKMVQRSAYLLINPREEQDFVKYSFPSKTLEYMLTGRPVLMNKLSCLSNEYDNLLFYVEEGKTLEQSILDILDMDSDFLLERGINARKFVIMYKNPTYQTSKIIKMLQR